MTKFKVIPAVHLILIDTNDQLLLTRRFNTGYEDGKYSVIAGHVEEGETVKQAMIREALEEASISIEENDIEFIHVMYRKREKVHASDRVDFFFKCQTWKGIPKIMESDKCDDMTWYFYNKLPENIIPYVKSAIQEYTFKKKFSEYGW